MAACKCPHRTLLAAQAALLALACTLPLAHAAGDADAQAQLQRWSAAAGALPTPSGAACSSPAAMGASGLAPPATAVPTTPARHASTGKPWHRLAPALDPERFTDTARSDKWFRHNCKDVLSRECTAAEKADVLAWLVQRTLTEKDPPCLQLLLHLPRLANWAAPAGRGCGPWWCDSRSAALLALACALPGALEAPAFAESSHQMPASAMLPAYQQSLRPCHMASTAPAVLARQLVKKLASMGNLGAALRHRRLARPGPGAPAQHLAAGQRRHLQSAVREAPPQDRITPIGLVRAQSAARYSPPSGSAPPWAAAPTASPAHTRADQGDFDDDNVRIPKSRPP